MRNTVRKIDAHQHFWRVDAQEQPWRDAHQDAIARDFAPADLRPTLEEIGIGETVLVESTDGPEENDHLTEYSREPFVAGVVAWLPISQPLDARRELRRVSLPKLVGVRCLIDDDPLEWLADRDVVALFRDLAERHLSWDVVPITDKQIANIITLAKAVPELSIVIDHLGRPPVGGDEDIAAWKGRVDRLAACPNISMKVSVGLHALSAWPAWDAAELRACITHAAMSFGARRLMIASNWPVVTLRASYREAWTSIESELRAALGDDADAVLGATAARVYGLDRGTVAGGANDRKISG